MQLLGLHKISAEGRGLANWLFQVPAACGRARLTNHCCHLILALDIGRQRPVAAVCLG